MLFVKYQCILVYEKKIFEELTKFSLFCHFPRPYITFLRCLDVKLFSLIHSNRFRFLFSPITTTTYLRFHLFSFLNFAPSVLSHFRGGGGGEIAYLNDQDSYAGWSFNAPVRATQARQVE